MSAADAGVGAPRETGANRPLRLYPFKTGTLTVPHQWIRNNEFAEEDAEVVASWWVITHPRGDMIIDGGVAAAAGVDDVEHWGETVTLGFKMRTHMTPEEAVIPSLERSGFDPRSIDRVLQTHLHIDHMGALAELPNFSPDVRVVTTRKEWQYMRSPDPYYAGPYSSVELRQEIDWMLLEDQEDPCDLYGDGTVIAYPTPGHSPGHLSYLVTLPESGPILLTGDACYTDDHWHGRSAAGFATSHLEAFRSVDRLHNIADRVGAQVFYGHDLEQFVTLRQDGEFYA
jgi:glyoxylase-like metal-dependent hydrolase (beta-lactamase superfamily II)